jgi:hypothetical protein
MSIHWCTNVQCSSAFIDALKQQGRLVFCNFTTWCQEFYKCTYCHCSVTSENPPSGNYQQISVSDVQGPAWLESLGLGLAWAGSGLQRWWAKPLLKAQLSSGSAQA